MASLQTPSPHRTLLDTAPLAPLLARLFAEAEHADAGFLAELGRLPDTARETLMRSGDYPALYGRARTAFLAVSPDTARLLYMLARARRARHIVEFGTSFGLSTLHLAAALRDNGGGRLISTELEPEKIVRARAHLAEASLDDLVELRAGDALQTLAADLPETVDLVLLDGAKILYPRILALIEPHLAPGALIVADNADDSPAYLSEVRADGSGYLSVPFAADVELSLWCGAA